LVPALFDASPRRYGSPRIHWLRLRTTSLNDVAELVTADNSVDYGQFRMPFKVIVSVLPK